MLKRLLAWFREPRFVWTFSGVSYGANNAPADAGFLVIHKRMTRARALREVARIAPHGAVIHVDDENKIITYRTN